jgi:transposase
MIRKAYPTDITDAEWEIISPLVPEAKAIGRPRQVDLREIINGIFYVLHEGCTWRALPHDLPPWQTSYNYFRHWQQLGVWQQIHAQLRTQVRVSVNKTNTPTASIIDSQSVKTAPKRGKYMVTMAGNRSRGVNALSSLIR